MYLYNITLENGRAVIVAERPSQALAIIRHSIFFEDDFEGLSDKDILKEVKEVANYKVKGVPGIIMYYKSY